jgi:hypothetical protein
MTLCSSSVALLRQPVHVAEMLTLVPAAAGCSSAFHVGSGPSKGVNVAMSYGGHTALGQGRAPQPSPKGCRVALTVASTE